MKKHSSHRFGSSANGHTTRGPLGWVSFGAGLLAGIGSVGADPLAVVTTPENPAQLVGTEIMKHVMNVVLTSLPRSQVSFYAGLGSARAERQMEGSAEASDPSCTPTDANGGNEGNPGCQENRPDVAGDARAHLGRRGLQGPRWQ
jgi:hypothetical protein